MSRGSSRSRMHECERRTAGGARGIGAGSGRSHRNFLRDVRGAARRPPLSTCLAEEPGARPRSGARLGLATVFFVLSL